MKIIRIVSLLLIVACAAFSQTATRGYVLDNPAPNLALYETDSVDVPTSAGDVITGTIWLTELTLSNTTASNVTCTIQDKQTTPKVLFSAAVTPGIYIMQFKARKMKGGVTWSCGATGVVGYISGKRLE